MNNTLLKLETDRLFLRKMSQDDCSFLIEIMNDPDWLQFIGNRHIYTEADALEHIENVANDMYRKHALGMLVVIEKATGLCVGLAGMLKRDNLAHPDIGYAFLPSGRGKGYALEACQTILDCAVDQHPNQPFLAMVDAQNTASSRLLIKLGFVFERKMEDDKPNEVHLYRWEQP